MGTGSLREVVEEDGVGGGIPKTAGELGKQCAILHNILP